MKKFGNRPLISWELGKLKTMQITTDKTGTSNVRYPDPLLKVNWIKDLTPKANF